MLISQVASKGYIVPPSLLRARVNQVLKEWAEATKDSPLSAEAAGDFNILDW